MKVDISIVKSYLDGDDYSQHWLFNSILDDGTHVFEAPQPTLRETVGELLEKVTESLADFSPYNADLFSKLFPSWKELSKGANVILSVGCPPPYDAMVREHNGKEYMIFDLVRFLDYQSQGYDVLSIMRGLVTHELTHLCVHNDYPVCDGNYKDKLEYITFDEGFAHLLSLLDDVGGYNFESMIKSYYNDSLNKLKTALDEQDKKEQERYLLESNCGQYWDKFAAISGKLYLAAHLDEIYLIYKNGASTMLKDMLK